MTRRDPYSRTVVRLPERDLAELVLELAAPLLERLGPVPAVDDARAVVALAVSFWNASVLASKLWGAPRVKELNALKKRMRGRAAAREDAATFDLLAERWRDHWLDPRLVESWTYEPDGAGVPRLVCTMGLPEGVRAEVPPPAEKRVAIGGKFLDEVQISQGGNTSLSFPVDRHRGVVGEDGTATVYAMMPSALKLFAEDRLPRVDGDAVDVAIGGRKLGPMVLTEVRCGGENYRHDIAVLIFRRPGAEGGTRRAGDGAALRGGRSTPVDHAGRPLGSRVPLRTPIVERDADVSGEHRADARVQLRTPRSSVVFRAFVASRFDGASDLAEAARSRSHIVAFQTRRPIVQPEPRSSRGDRGFAFLASCRGDARPRRSRTRSPRARWRVGARDRARPIALSGPVLGGDWGERGRGPFNRNRDPFYRPRKHANPSPPESAPRRRAWLLMILGPRC